jgi:hypothetical protein
VSKRRRTSACRQPVGEFASLEGQAAAKPLVRDPPEQQRVGVERLVEFELVAFVAAVDLERPAAVLELASPGASITPSSETNSVTTILPMLTLPHGAPRARSHSRRRERNWRQRHLRSIGDNVRTRRSMFLLWIIVLILIILAIGGVAVSNAWLQAIVALIVALFAFLSGRRAV